MTKSKVHNAVSNIVYSPVVNKLFTNVGGRRLYAEFRVRQLKKKLLAEAKTEFAKGKSLGSFDDYKQALKKHWVSYKEYTEMYEFYRE